MVEFPFYHESRKQWASLRKQDLSKVLMGTKEFVCLGGMLEKNIPEKCRTINGLSLPRTVGFPGCKTVRTKSLRKRPAKGPRQEYG